MTDPKPATPRTDAFLAETRWDELGALRMAVSEKMGELEITLSAAQSALAHAQAALTDPASVPSARIIDEMVRNYDSSYTSFVLDYSIRHRKTLLGLPLSAEVDQRFEQLARQSLEEQRRIEAGDNLPFEAYRQRYLSEASIAS